MFRVMCALNSLYDVVQGIIPSDNGFIGPCKKIFKINKFLFIL